VFGLLRLVRFIPGARLLGTVSPWWWIRRLVLLLVLGYVALSMFVVWSAVGAEDRNEKFDAIIVLGAAQYNGKPSPVLKRRLDHALEIYKSHRKSLVVVTGGRQAGDKTTEASAAAKYLIKRGVPDARIEREVQGRDTYQSIAASARFLRRARVTRVLFVTDGYHAARVRGIGREVGLTSFVSSVGGSGSASRLAREGVAVGLGELISYRRLSAILE
jgi:uncharacterized SAM-binding protein YcdF (DUF218 family)